MAIEFMILLAGLCAAFLVAWEVWRARMMINIDAQIRDEKDAGK
jgi:hypothetical protein